jgi:plasmid stability protein
MKNMTIRNVDRELSVALEREKARRRVSLNRTVLDLLRERLGLAGGRPPSNGLAEQAGSWSVEDLESFESATAPFEEVDEELWS